MYARHLQVAAIAVTLLVSSGDFAFSQGTTAGDTVVADTARDDDGFDWGWLGLLGLIGLAGLMRRDRDTHGRTTTTR